MSAPTGRDLTAGPCASALHAARSGMCAATTRRSRRPTKWHDGWALNSSCTSLRTALQQASRRRLALACVLAARPQLLLLDGFLDGLAPPESAAMVAPIRGLCAEGVTVLMAERVMPAVSRLADDVAVLSGGRLIAHGSPGQVSRDPAVTRAYAGHVAPPGNRAGAGHR
ncbi:hypothetical protein ACTMU2_01080 [Cupriavidus basilensis]